LAYWRPLANRLRRIAERLGSRTAPMREAAGAERPDPVEPGEVALILLKNAARLLDQSMAPAEIRAKLEGAIRELEEFVAGGR